MDKESEEFYERNYYFFAEKTPHIAKVKTTVEFSSTCLIVVEFELSGLIDFHCL